MAGRPRSKHVDDAIARATRALLIEHGWPGLSMEALAREAGVSKSTIYRRYNGLAELVLDVIFAAVQIPDMDPNTPWRQRLEQAVMTLGMGFHIPEVRAATMGMMSSLSNDPILREHLQRQILGPNAEQIQSLVQEGIDHGDIPTTTDPTLVANLLGGMLFWNAIVMESPATYDDIQQAIAHVVR